MRASGAKLAVVGVLLLTAGMLYAWHFGVFERGSKPSSNAEGAAATSDHLKELWLEQQEAQKAIENDPSYVIGGA